jgi:ABC-type transport system involved in multi-copper enzyme maturation permease subunit
MFNPTDENDVVTSEIIYIYDAEKVEENTKTIILPQLYNEAITQTIQDISTTTDENASGQIVTENIIESQYEQRSFYINHISVCFILSIICMLILIMIFHPR